MSGPKPEELLAHLRIKFEEYLRRIGVIDLDTNDITLEELIAVLKIKIKPNLHSDEALEQEVYRSFRIQQLNAEQKQICKRYLSAMAELV